MQTSIFLAKLIGPVMFVIGLSALANQSAMRDMVGEFTRSPAMIFLSGLMLMPVGLAVVLSHNVWVASWPVLITLLGWVAIIGGAARLLAPQRLARVGTTLHANQTFAIAGGAFWLIAGALLCYFGFR